VVALESVQLDHVEERVYTFHVAELQNYAVGGCGVLVHNTNDPIKERYRDPAAAIGATDGYAKFISEDETKEEFWRDNGFRKHQIYEDSNGEFHHVFYDPDTGDYSGGGHSSHIDYR
jgi:hypothetical protein